MSFTIEQRSKIVKFYLETKSLVQTQREYRKHFGVKEAPSVTSIKKIVQKFEVHGTCHNRNKGNSGRRVSARTECGDGKANGDKNRKLAKGVTM